MFYADSSLLVSYYLTDAHSARATHIIESSADPFAFTDLHALEVRNAFRLAEFRKQITAEEAEAAWKDVRNDLTAGLLERVVFSWPAVFRRASGLSDHHTARQGNRSLDILHVGADLARNAAEFVSFDDRQTALAWKAAALIRAAR